MKISRRVVAFVVSPILPAIASALFFSYEWKFNDPFVVDQIFLREWGVTVFLTIMVLAYLALSVCILPASRLLKARRLLWLPFSVLVGMTMFFIPFFLMGGRSVLDVPGGFWGPAFFGDKIVQKAFVSLLACGILTTVTFFFVEASSQTNT